MLRRASASTGEHIYRLLVADLKPVLTAAEIRVAELGFLSSLLVSPLPAGSQFLTFDRERYDQLRPATAPSGRQLVDTYGSWSRACRAAYGLQPDGTTTGPSKPWPSPNRDGHDSEKYTREECIKALRKCDEDLRASGLIGPPTSAQYDEWVRRRKLEAKAQGKKLRWPYARHVYRLFSKVPKGRSRWEAVLRAAGLTGSK